jgi:hypothetical protein
MCRRSALVEQPFVDVAPVSNCEQIQLIPAQIELINDAEVADTNPESIHALHPVVWEIAEVLPKSINPVLNPALDVLREAEEPLVKLRGINLCRRAARRIHGRWMR